jgi:hypothetical protein
MAATAPTEGRPRADIRVGRWALGCAAVAALSLLVLHEPSYDSTAWLIWGRQLVHGTLDTVGGPSWKPLPVALTTVFSLTGSTVAPLLWLFFARTAGLIAVLLVYVLTRRLGSRREAVIAALAFALAADVAYNSIRGDSEGLLVALALGAVIAHIDGRRRLAFGLGVGAALLRPEVWPLVALEGLVLIRRGPRLATILCVLGAGVLVLALWLGPELVTSGDALGAARRAQNPVPGTPAQSAVPFLATFALASIMLCWPVYAGAVYRVIVAWRDREQPRERIVLGIAAGSTVVMLIVAALSEVGFTGNLRYDTLPAAGLCVIGGLGLPSLVAALRAGPPAALTYTLAALGAVGVAISIGIVIYGGERLADAESVYGHQLPRLIDRLGGPAAVRACGPVATTPFGRQAVAWRLDLPQRVVRTDPIEDGTVIGREGRTVRESLLPERARTASLIAKSRCAL